jgi:hypothetical protein
MLPSSRNIFHDGRTTQRYVPGNGGDGYGAHNEWPHTTTPSIV